MHSELLISLFLEPLPGRASTDISSPRRVEFILSLNRRSEKLIRGKSEPRPRSGERIGNAYYREDGFLITNCSKRLIVLSRRWFIVIYPAKRGESYCNF